MLVVSCLLSVAFEAFQVNFNVQLWVLILIGVAVSGYVMFEIALGYMAATEEREKASAESTRLVPRWKRRASNSSVPSNAWARLVGITFALQMAPSSKF